MFMGGSLRGEACTINGDGETSRDFYNVQNVVQANLLAKKRVGCCVLTEFILYSGNNSPATGRLGSLYGCLFVFRGLMRDNSKTRSIVYIDGFNLYYGALRGSPNKWLDLEQYFKRLRPDDELLKIWYFTAIVSGGARGRQAAYLEALQTRPLVGIKYGLYKSKTLKCGVQACTHEHRKYVSVEEKGTDVNIALQMIDDAYQGLTERMILVSGDSDLVPAVKLVKDRFPKIQITVYVPATHPTRGAATELRRAADKDATLPLTLLPKCQFPPTLSDGQGSTLIKPLTW